ncbi:Farnesyl-diphosphate farnesyltransferase [Artemisia annua]|uniref:Farnesyl-diphosphate farnesyltransferase n=1 Tax=Artemisia annua TaxID=35608 RepID=A0A2U1MHE5_ARTAN|nr:Farnesyl-diphosphate farnesyltransferase [Artemisia annua]
MWGLKAVLKHLNASNPLLKRKMIPGKPLGYSTLRHEWSLNDVLNHPNDIFPLLKLKMAMKKAEKEIPTDPNWGFCYSILPRVSSSFALIIPLLDYDSRDILYHCSPYVVPSANLGVSLWTPMHMHTYAYGWNHGEMPMKRNIATTGLEIHAGKEDDTSIATEIKVPILKAFHRHIYDRDWHFSCGTKENKVLMDNFHHVSDAFLELDKSYQEVLENTIMRMGAGMSKYICKEVYKSLYKVIF